MEEMEEVGSKTPPGPRSTMQQKACLINYMQAHDSFAHGHFNGPQGASGLKRQWERLATKLNNVDNGGVRSVALWKWTWNDIKRRAREKSIAVICHRNSTGHFPEGEVFDVLERKVLAIMGRTAIEGIPGGTKDSLPRSEAALLRLMTGDRDAVDEDEPESSLFATYGIGQDPIDEPEKEQNSDLGITTQEMPPAKRKALTNNPRVAVTSERSASVEMPNQSAARPQPEAGGIENMDQAQVERDDRREAEEYRQIVREFEELADWLEISD